MYFPFTTAKSLTGFGREHARMMSAMDRLQMILVLAIDPPDAENRVTVDADGRPVVRYRFTDVSPHFVRLAGERFAGTPGLEFGVLDFDRDPDASSPRFKLHSKRKTKCCYSLRPARADSNRQSSIRCRPAIRCSRLSRANSANASQE